MKTITTVALDDLAVPQYTSADERHTDAVEKLMDDGMSYIEAAVAVTKAATITWNEPEAQ